MKVTSPLPSPKVPFCSEELLREKPLRAKQSKLQVTKMAF